jgi:hypothetical protein
MFDRLGPADLEGTGAASFAPRTEHATVSPAERRCSGLPTEALRCYLDLAEGNEAIRAESALYQAGWITLRDLHDPSGALRIWSEERRRFPDGPLAEEAQTSSIDALVALEESERARAEIDTYLRRYPKGLRAPEMHFIKGTLLVQTDHSCRRAMSEFTLALHHPAPPWDARARAALGRCTASATH